MLLNLHVKNLALIEECDVDFQNGLNILSGETGAGKSIIIGSINLALGAKAAKDIIRDDKDYALVELVFKLDTKKQAGRLKELGILLSDDDQVIISRRLMNGRSISKINGETQPVSVIKAVAEELIDIHGQHEHQSLMHKKNHLAIVDEYGKKDGAKVKEELKKAYEQYDAAAKKLAESRLDEEQRAREISFAEFEIKDIEEAALLDGEDEALEEIHKKMINGKKIVEAMSVVYGLTGYEEQGSAGDGVGRALKELNQIVDYDSGLEGLCGQLQDIDALLNDFNREAADYLSGMEFSEDEFRKTEERLDLINRLKAKYGKSIADILQYKEELEVKLQKLYDYAAYMERLEADVHKAEEKAEHLADRLSSIRQKYGKELSKKIKQSLIDLNFLNVDFEVSFERLSKLGANGYDDVEFKISTNPGEGLKPLAKIASGGELSRIMLAIKTLLSDKDEIGTLIFDEVDVGISGRTAQKVSEKMAVIGRCHQVLCITHLPQIAAMADSHYIIEKKVTGKKTVTSIKRLEEGEIVSELARMLSGAEITETVLKNAEEMKELATRTKKA